MNALVTAQTSNVEAYRSSTDAAGLCREIVLATAQNIQGRRYVKVEGWQAIAIAHGCTASARAVERVDGGVRAIGEVRRMGDGAVIAEGEGFVGEDEATWYGGEVVSYGKKKTLPKRPDYAIRAMAQTRAISRACRSAFAHVVVMIDASLSTTPAEEVPAGGFDHGDVIDVELEGTPTIRKSAHQARKDGDYERLTGGMRAAAKEGEAALQAWAKSEAELIGAQPHGWQNELRKEYGELLAEVRARAADPFGLKVDTPEGTDAGDWLAWLDVVVASIEGAPDAEQVRACQSVNAEGLAACAAVVEGTVDRIAEVADQRLAALAVKEAA